MLKLRLLASAFAPVALIAAIRLSDDHLAWAVVLLLVALLATLSLVELILARSSTNQQPYLLTDVSDESDQIPAYLLTFVFPFLFLAVDNWQDIAAYVVFVLLLVLLMLRTDLVLVNPLLLVVGYHLYSVKSSTGYSGLLLSSKRPMIGQTIQAVRISRGAIKLTEIQQ